MFHKTSHHEFRVRYGASYKTHPEAEIGIEDLFAEGVVSASEKPRAEYVGGTKPWIITIKG